MFDREPDLTYSDQDALEDGVLVDLRELGVSAYFAGREGEYKPITRMSAGLFDAFERYNPGGTVEEQSAACQALLAFVVCDACDTALEGEPRGFIYESQNCFHGLGCERVWLMPNGHGWTAMLPQDR